MQQYYLWRDYGYLIALFNGSDLDYARMCRPSSFPPHEHVYLSNLYLSQRTSGPSRSPACESQHAIRALRDKVNTQPSTFPVGPSSPPPSRNHDSQHEDRVSFCGNARTTSGSFRIQDTSAAVGYALLGNLDEAFPLFAGLARQTYPRIYRRLSLGSGRSGTVCAMIRASRKSSPRSRRNNSANFSDKFGHENCVILRENNNAVILPLRR